MINIIKDIESFFEDYDDEIIIYGAGNSGYWVGYYMNKCHMDFSCYIDKGIKNEGELYNAKPVYSQKKLAEYAGRHIRIFVSIAQYQTAVYELLELSQKYGFSAQCFVSVHHPVGTPPNTEAYAINISLGYFRNKLLRGGIPTIISNDCTAGVLYKFFGLPITTPTKNVIILEEDYVKLFKNPKYYFGIEVNNYELGRLPAYLKPNNQVDWLCSRIDDITIYWIYAEDKDNFLQRWNNMRKKIDYNNLMFCMSDLRFANTYNAWKQFAALKQRHLAIRYGTRCGFTIDEENTIVVNQPIVLMQNDIPIENSFDLLGWFNRSV